MSRRLKEKMWLARWDVDKIRRTLRGKAVRASDLLML
jgi:hypothetical protein